MLLNKPTTLFFQFKLLNRNNLISQVRWFGSNWTRLRFKPSHETLYLTPGKLWKPFSYAVGITIFSFSAATIIEYERCKKRFRSKADFFNFINQNFNSRNSKRYNQLDATEKTFFVICAINLAILAFWRFNRNYQHLWKYFTLNSFNKPLLLPMILSMMTHTSIIHAGVNLFALQSFVSALSQQLGNEQLWALYFSSGAFSAFTGILNKVLTKSTTSSLGASGAIIGIISASCVLNPDSKIGLIFIPTFTFPAKYGLYALITFDTLGLLLKWKVMDHAVHLGGAFFGIWYVLYGQKLLWNKRWYLTEKWHKLRKNN